MPAFPRGCVSRAAGACTYVGVRCCTIVSESGLSDKRQDAEWLPSLSRSKMKPPRFTARFYFSKSFMPTAFLPKSSEPFLLHSIVGLSASLLSRPRFQLRDLAFQRIFLRYESWSSLFQKGDSVRWRGFHSGFDFLQRMLLVSKRFSRLRRE